MSSTKHCFREVDHSGRLWGFGAVELFIFVSTFAVWAQLGTRPLRGLVLGGVLAGVCRLLRRGRLPGSGLALFAYFWHGRRFVAGGMESRLPCVSSSVPDGLTEI
jgi:hypothetical protein